MPACAAAIRLALRGYFAKRLNTPRKLHRKKASAL
jgi:hypothetical protein